MENGKNSVYSKEVKDVGYSRKVLKSALGKLEGKSTSAAIAQEFKKKYGKKPPLYEVVKLNTDGAARGNPGVAGAGGVIRNSSGDWLVGFTAHLGVCSNVAAELHALRLGLLLAWQEGYRAIVCEVDVKVILDLLKSNTMQYHPLRALLMDIREMFSWEWQCECRHTLREGNFCADKLSKMGCDLDVEYEIFCVPPQQVIEVFQADGRGIAFPRGFTSA
ncbi:hypothetical protein CCACVL1_01125 [Corchorus capsularis]|uniref:RNase H type-1 domain-containing protein n=1 Tax=Corchorus capsularis TaxID=210143 RepID=A0A1R3KML2_COCAP|nr:hypothetical protein CCACVL1_01125 [Corchorus capsularis]